MDKLEPPAVSFDGNVSHGWKKWSKHFDFFLTATESDTKSDKVKLPYFYHALGLKVETFMKHFRLVLKETTSNSNQFLKSSTNTAILVRTLLSFVTNSSHISSKKVSPLMILLLSLKDAVLNVNLIHFRIH